MSFNDPIEKKQGSIKASEIFLDRDIEIIKNQIGETGLKTIELMAKAVSDSLRKTSYILHSTGELNWTGTQIQFDADNLLSNLILKLMLMDEGSPKTVDLYMEGGASNTATQFQNINLGNNELLYIELDRDLIKGAVSPNPGVEPARLAIRNAVGGGSTFSGATLKKISMSDTTGMPEMLATETGSSKSQTMNIPLAARFDWTDGLDTYQDVWWIPHGIRWPEDTKSNAGAVVVRGLETLPSTFVRTQSELVSAVLALGSTGGIILVSETIEIDQNITIPPGVTLCARSDLCTSTQQAAAKINMLPGGSLTLDNDAKLWNILVEGASNFGLTPADMIILSNNHAKVEECTFHLTNSSGMATCIRVTGTSNRMWHNSFKLGPGDIGSRVGINYSGGSNNVDTDSDFDFT